jgi:hypothetical protein
MPAGPTLRWLGSTRRANFSASVWLINRVSAVVNPYVINASFHASFSIWHRIAVKAAAAFSCTHQQSGHSLQGSSYRTQEQQSKVRACRSAASPHTAGHDAHVGGLTWRPALSVIHAAPFYPDRIRGVCEGASGAVRLVQAQARLWQADLRRFSQPLGGVSMRFQFDSMVLLPNCR